MEWELGYHCPVWRQQYKRRGSGSYIVCRSGVAFIPKEKALIQKMHQWPERRDSQITHETKGIIVCECQVVALSNYAEAQCTAINEKIDADIFQMDST